MIFLSSNYLRANQTIGIVGGGQLGRMLALAAKAMGYRIAVLDPAEDCPASQVSDQHLIARYDDSAALQKLAEIADVVTYEFENVDYEALQEIENLVSIPQGTDLLSITQDRILEKAYLESANINIAPYAVIVTRDDIEAEISSIGYPAVLKTVQGGYDGKGQVVISKPEDITEAEQLLQYGSCVLEAWIPFEKEISIVVARNFNGQIEVFPASENVHKHNILHTSRVPALINQETNEEAEGIAFKLAEVLQLQGVLAVEMFVTKSGAIYVNELAPRPHNSGHYTIEACTISQFTQHIRAIAGLPLLKPELLKPAVMVNILGQHVAPLENEIPNYPRWYVHYYGKQEARENRKMGHITILTDNPEATLQDIKELKIWD